MVAAHDKTMMLASIRVYDPHTRTSHGNGIGLNPLSPPKT